MRTGMVRPGRRMAAAVVTTLAAAGAIAPVAGASIDPDAPVRTGRNVTVLPQIDMVATFGHPLGQRLQVEVLRGGHPIARTSGWAVATAEGGALEVNHGVEEGVVPQPGDCWEQVTPDITAFDRIVVTDAAGAKDGILVDDLGVSAGPLNEADGVAFLGWARSARTGLPIELDLMEAESRQRDFRVGTIDFRAHGAEAGGFRALYPRSGLGVIGVASMMDPATTHAIGFGHAPIVVGDVERMQRDTQLIDVGAAAGPAAGCELQAPAAGADAATVLDDPMVTTRSGDLVVSGTAAHDVARVDLALSDGAGGSAGAHTEQLDAAVRAPAGAPRAWTATIPREALDALAPEATLTVQASFTTAAGATRAATRALTVRRDVSAPQPPTATPGPGELDAPRSVRLRAEPGAAIHVTLDGSEPTTGSERYGAPLLVDAPATIRAIAVDAAGNVSAPATLAFTRRAVAPPAAAPPAAAPAPALVPGLGPASALRVAGVSLRQTRVSLRQARREGVVARFVAPRGARYAEARLLRTGAGGTKRLVSTRLMAAAPGRAQLARFTGAAVRRRLSRGRYVVEVRAGEAPTRLGAPATTAVRIG